MFWINQFREVFLVALCDLDVSTFVFSRWAELCGQNPPYCRGGKLRFKARKFDMLLQMFGTLGALLHFWSRFAAQIIFSVRSNFLLC